MDLYASTRMSGMAGMEIAHRMSKSARRFDGHLHKGRYQNMNKKIVPIVSVKVLRHNLMGQTILRPNFRMS